MHETYRMFLKWKIFTELMELLVTHLFHTERGSSQLHREFRRRLRLQQTHVGVNLCKLRQTELQC